MSTATHSEPLIPALDSLGDDLLATSRASGDGALARPIIGLAAYGLAAYAHWWWSTPFLVFLIFVAVVTVTHDVVHGSLACRADKRTGRCSPWVRCSWRAAMPTRATHLRHHRVFPGPGDPEGDPARLTLTGAILWGPFFLPRLWCWALSQSKPGARRSWLIAEAVWPVSVIAIGIWLLPVTSAVLLYSLVIAGSWVYPLLTVHLPHRHYGDTPFTQTHTLRGRIIPALFLELTYHLEHHLYPEVPSHNLPELSRRLDGTLRRAGVRPRRVP